MIWLFIALGLVVAIVAWAIAEELLDTARYVASADATTARINAPVGKN